MERVGTRKWLLTSEYLCRWPSSWNIWVSAGRAPRSQHRRPPSLGIPYLETYTRKERGAEREKLYHYESTQDGTFGPVSSQGLLFAGRMQFPGGSQNVLPAYQDRRSPLYTMYKRESAEYDTDYVKKCDEDLNTTLIFVRYLSANLVNHLTYSLRPAYSQQSAPPLSSTSVPTSEPIPTNNRSPPPPCHPPHSQPIRHSRRDPRCSASSRGPNTRSLPQLA